MKSKMKLVFLLSLFFTPVICLAQGDLIVYPNNNQTKEQMEKDKFECYTWAKNETGFDPMATPTASTPPPQQQAPKGGVVKGAARGAVVGTATGAIAGDTGKGAAIGASSGALVGGMRRREQRRQEQYSQDQWAQQETAKYNEDRNRYNRAYSACLEGKNYSVK